MPTSHKIHPPPPSFTEKHPLWSPNGCQFLRQPTADPFRPGNCRPAKEPKSPGASISFLFFPLPTLRWLCWLLAQAWERRVERHRERAAKKERERRRESARVCIFNLIAPSLHFAPRFKKPTYSSSSSSGRFSNMTRISPELMFSRWQDGSHEPCSRQPCVLTVDFESELRSILFVGLFLTKGRTRSHENPPPPQKTSALIVVIYLSSSGFCVLSHRAPNMSGWLRLSASGSCVEDFFSSSLLGQIQDNPATVWLRVKRGKRDVTAEGLRV